MSTIPSTPIDRFRHPEYTGENRCMPCTVVNLLIATVVATVVGTVLVPAGVLVFGVCALTIYFRGYLIPGTPTLTKRYLPERVYRLFGTHYEADVGTDENDLEALLKRTGVVVDCPDEDDLCLHSEFRKAWREDLIALREDGNPLERFAGRIGIEAEALGTEQFGGRYAVTYEGNRVGIWPSEAAFLADLTAAPLLDERSRVWTELAPEEQGQVLTALRSFLETCPDCDGPIVGNEEMYETCCRTKTRMSVECENCGTVVFSGQAT